MNNDSIARKYKKSTSESLVKKKEDKLMNQPYSMLNNFIQLSIGDDVQGFMDTDRNGKPTFANGIVKYGYGKRNEPLKGKDNVEIVFLNAFSETETDQIDQKQKQLENEKLGKEEISEIIEKQIEEVLYKPIVRIKETEYQGKMQEASYSQLLKKTELFFVTRLYNTFSGERINNSTIQITDTQLASIFNVNRSYINREMNKVIIALSQIQIRSYIPHKAKISKRGNGGQLETLRLVNLIQDARHEDGITEITFNDKFAKHISSCTPLQIPNEIYQIKDALTYDITLYLYGQTRQRATNTFKIKVSTLYDTIKQIKRYENVNNWNYSRDIYQPVEKAFDYLEEKGLLQINYENTEFIAKTHSVKNEPISTRYDFNKWLDTNLVIKVLKAPDYSQLKESKTKYKQLAEKNSQKKAKKQLSNG